MSGNKLQHLHLLLLSLLVMLPAGALHAQKAPYAEISFDKVVHDFGSIEESGLAYCEFEFTNTGTAAMEIRRVNSSCGCTTPEYPKTPIVPGAKGIIKVAYNTVGRPGPFNKSIAVYSNATANPTVMLSIRGSVLSKKEDAEKLFPNTMGGLRLKRTAVPLGDVLIGSIKTETIPVYNQNEAPINISFNKVPRHMRVLISKPGLEHGATGIITINYIPAESGDYGFRQDYFYIVTDPGDKENPANKITVSANIKENFSGLGPLDKVPRVSYSPARLDFGRIKASDKPGLELVLTNLGEKPLLIRKAKATCDCISIKADSKAIDPGKEKRIRISLEPGKYQGNVYYMLEIITNDPKQPLVKIPITAYVLSE